MCIITYSYTKVVGVFMVLRTVEDAGPYNEESEHHNKRSAQSLGAEFQICTDLI